jgi:hypothetical protein
MSSLEIKIPTSTEKLEQTKNYICNSEPKLKKYFLGLIETELNKSPRFDKDGHFKNYVTIDLTKIPFKYKQAIEFNGKKILSYFNFLTEEPYNYIIAKDNNKIYTKIHIIWSKGFKNNYKSRTNFLVPIQNEWFVDNNYYIRHNVITADSILYVLNSIFIIDIAKNMIIGNIHTYIQLDNINCFKLDKFQVYINFKTYISDVYQNIFGSSANLEPEGSTPKNKENIELSHSDELYDEFDSSNEEKSETMIKVTKIINYTTLEINKNLISEKKTIQYLYRFFPDSNFKLLFNRTGMIQDRIEMDNLPVNKYTLYVIKLNKNGLELYNNLALVP